MKSFEPCAKKSTNNIKINIKPSRIHALGFMLILPVLFLSIFNSQLIHYGWIVFPALMIYAFNHYLHHFGFKSVRVLRQQTDGLWTLNEQSDFQLLSSSSIRRYWAILYFKPRKVVAIFPDSLGREEFRRLRRQHHIATHFGRTD